MRLRTVALVVLAAGGLLCGVTAILALLNADILGAIIAGAFVATAIFVAFVLIRNSESPSKKSRAGKR